MNKSSKSFVVLSSITLDDPTIKKSSVSTKVTVTDNEHHTSTFVLQCKYQQQLTESHRPLLRLACIMPLLNYGLFTKNIYFQFPISTADMALVQEFHRVFSKDIFVNKILRRRANYILPQYVPDETKITAQDAEPKAELIPLKLIKDTPLGSDMDPWSCGILSSGGKESLLTYGLLKEIGCTVSPFYVNESGGHWRTALPAYRYHEKNEPNTQRVWTNLDRFYTFMLDHLAFIRPDHRTVRADTYPLRLCLFPVYVFLLLPIFVANHVGNLLIGSEFDDLRSTPIHHNITHYYGIYDQHQDYDRVMNAWYTLRIPGLIQWSAVRCLTGLIEEKILVDRYPSLARVQRSCHSCHFEGEQIVPCGTCSKCMGILLFLLANNVDPRIMQFKEKDIHSFTKRVQPANLRLDQDEQQQSFHLIGHQENIPLCDAVPHVEQIHINSNTCDPCRIPEHLRSLLFTIFEHYTTGTCILQNEQWVKLEKPLHYLGC